MRTYPVFIISFAFLNVAKALYSGKYCPLACETSINYATFNDTDPWLSKKDQKPWCDEYAGVTLPYFHDIVRRWTSEEKAEVRRLSAEEALQFPYLGEIVIPKETFFERAFTTVETAFWEYQLHLVYGWYMYYFWLVVVAIGITTRLLSLIRNLAHRNKTYRPLPEARPSVSSEPQSIFSPPYGWLKGYLIVPATFGDRCSRTHGWCTIPSRIQSLTILLFVMLNVVLCSCSYRLTDGNLYWPGKPTQLMRFVSDRTGIISLANFPLVWLFGMRNDAVMWMTGWGFGTYNAFHRWVARVATLQAVIHSLGYTLMIFLDGGWPLFRKYLTKHYFWNGELATGTMCALLAFSVYGMRRAHYEIFLVTHIILSIVTLWAMYYHVEIFINGEWNIFIWPCLGVWAFDRVLRLARILAFDRNPLDAKATVSYDACSNLVRMDIDGSKNLIAPKPGTYYYIHVLDDLLYAYQNHPFTLAYVSSDIEESVCTSSSQVSRMAIPLLRTTSASSSESDALLATNTTKTSSTLVFLIRPYNGFTSRLKSHTLSHPKKLRVLVEGPYGHSVLLQTFPNVLFIVGGTGITVPISHLSHLLSTSSQVQSVRIVWAVREYAFLTSILRDFKGLLSDERIEMEVHITRDDEVKDDVLGEDLKSVRIMAHRPDVQAAVEGAARDEKQRRVAIVVCGPALMADQARKASAQMLRKGFSGVDYFEESFKW
ncbi:ferric-chelate reductase [Decorospora gaudefroyi]|uniref:Ferric-chelate reductase n=1 Tax=Decorospora gaudefroyi TaxID=184978 RepID=A0A6A5KGU2_9PLEO|nr:ferric-chelate reductase [Decorospora gaudefroyi]